MADDRAADALPDDSAGQRLDDVRWDYDPDAREPSPLEATRSYFEDFPWEPEDVFARD